VKKEILRRKTRQRNIILEELRKVKTHPAACDIYNIVRRKIPSISFGTIYRNLNLLREQGKILELSCGKYSSRYDATVTPHYHFCCLACKNVFDINVSPLKNLDKRIGKNFGFDVRYHQIDFFGYCDNCRQGLSFRQTRR
jgi:Fe2+ or Zn2+ uptake regulation protein